MALARSFAILSRGSNRAGSKPLRAASPEARLAAVSAAAKAQQLFVSGTLQIAADELSLTSVAVAKAPRTRHQSADNSAAAPLWLALLSAEEPGFWPHVSAQPEFHDGLANPLDRWSRRAIAALAEALGAKAVFPFGGPPWLPFLRWAERSGRSFASPVALHVHDRMGLWASWRGALVFDQPLPETAAPGGSPCARCVDQPCRTACPAQALVPGAYDLASCHDWLDTPAGNDCLTKGCGVRSACPLSRLYGRLAAESAHHMRHFHP